MKIHLTIKIRLTLNNKNQTPSRSIKMLRKHILLKDVCVELPFPNDACVPIIVHQDNDREPVMGTINAANWNTLFGRYATSSTSRIPPHLMAFFLSRAFVMNKNGTDQTLGSGSFQNVKDKRMFEQARALMLVCFDAVFMRLCHSFNEKYLFTPPSSLVRMVRATPSSTQTTMGPVINGFRKDESVFSMRDVKIEFQTFHSSTNSADTVLRATVSFQLFLRPNVHWPLSVDASSGNTSRVPALHRILFDLGIPATASSEQQLQCDGGLLFANAHRHRIEPLHTVQSYLQRSSATGRSRAPSEGIFVFRTLDVEVPQIVVDPQTMSVADAALVPTSARVVVDEQPFADKVRMLHRTMLRVREQCQTVVVCARATLGKWSDCLHALGVEAVQLTSGKDHAMLAVSAAGTLDASSSVRLITFEALAELDAAQHTVPAGFLLVDDAHAASVAACAAVRRIRTPHRLVAVTVDPASSAVGFRRLWSALELALPHIVVPAWSTVSELDPQVDPFVAHLMMGRVVHQRSQLLERAIGKTFTTESIIRRVTCAPTDRGRRMLLQAARQFSGAQATVRAVEAETDSQMRCTDWDWRHSPPVLVETKQDNRENDCPMCLETMHGKSVVENNACGHCVCVACWEHQCRLAETTTTCCVCRGPQTIGHTLHAVVTPEARRHCQSERPPEKAVKTIIEQEEPDRKTPFRNGREHFGPLSTKLFAVERLARNAVKSGTQLFVFARKEGTRCAIRKYLEKSGHEAFVFSVRVWPYDAIQPLFPFNAASKCVFFDNPPPAARQALLRLRANFMASVVELTIDWSSTSDNSSSASPLHQDLEARFANEADASSASPSLSE